jgi:hypothetical protein
MSGCFVLGWVLETSKIDSLVGDGGSLPERVVIDVNRLMRVKERREMQYLVRSGWKREKSVVQVEEMKVGMRRVKKRGTVHLQSVAAGGRNEQLPAWASLLIHPRRDPHQLAHAQAGRHQRGAL